MSATDVQLSPLQLMAEKLSRGDVTVLSDVLKAIGLPEKSAPAPERVPLPASITEPEKKALEKVAEVYGSVVPETRRALSQEELDTLHQERETLKAVEGLVGRRVEDITLTLNNHFDTLIEAELPPEELARVLRSKKGYYVTPEEAPCPEVGKSWKRTPRWATPDVDPVKLLKMAQAGEDPEFAHKEYLAVTTPTRVFDSNKFMLLLRRKPSLLKVIQKALTTPESNAAITVVPINND